MYRKKYNMDIKACEELRIISSIAGWGAHMIILLLILKKGVYIQEKLCYKGRYI